MSAELGAKNEEEDGDENVESLQRDMDWHNFADDDFVSIYTGLTPRVPSLDEFVEVARTSRPGFVEIALDGLSDYLTVSIVHSGSVILQSVKLFYKQCDAATFDGMQLSSSFSFSKPRPVPVLCRCPTPVLQTYVTAVCHPTTGWALQTLNPCCTHAQTTPVCTYDDCANGECRIEDGKKICDCRDGFHFVDNECVPASCSHTFCAASGGGTCLESGGGGTCHCSTDFTKSRFCELQNDWICPTCEPHHKCLMIIGSRADAAQHECVCAYEGRLGDCPPDPCRAHNCGSHGECVPDNHTDLGYSCRCEPGWVGEECRSPITCISTEDVYLCENGGTCDTNSTSPTCHCLTRFTGPTCNQSVDLCAGVQCLNGGSCLPTETGHFCYCASRFTGPYCEVEIDLCAEQNPCQQGNCLQETGHLRCNCSAGWSGEFCDVQLDLCQVSDPCVNGNCRGELPGFQFCDCNLDYRGNTCSENVTYCDFRPCFNNGTCVEKFSSGYSCRCGEGFTGANCETVIDLCADWPCENGGTCVVADHRPNPCDDVICMNGGTCYVHDKQAFCQCFADFTGLRCESRVDLCTSFTCENGGTCKIRDHSAKCDCIVGYGGVHCEKELTECEDFPEPLPCLNGGTCRVTADHRQYCECSINFYGTNCEVFGRSCAVINCNNGTCFNDTMLEGHCICPPDRTGEFCETVKSTSFNLYFNGQPSTQTIVSRDFPSTFLKEFTLCAWVFYAPLQPSDGSSLGRFLQLNTTTGAPILSMDNTGLTINDSFHIDVKISVMAWHHVCVRSPRFQDSDHPMWSVFLDGTFAANVSYAELAVSADLRCRIQIGDAGGPRRFRGEISLVHLYTAYLEDADIAKMAFQCRDWVATENPHLLLQWTDFTTVQRNNPGVMALYPGLCDVSDCLPGRSSCNTKDKIPPTVKSCPRNIRKLSSDRLTRVDWDTDEMFTDNVGVAAVKSNYRSGQSFTWGYYTVVYVASDAAGNTATCSFSVVVSPADCQTPTADSQLQGEVTFTSVNGTDATKTARVSCDDPFYPRNGPDFYICDVMGQWDRSIFWPANRTYIFSSCGATRDPAQTINGTLEDYGNCSSIRQSLFDSLENDLRRSNCTGEISIDSSCPNNVTNYVKRHTERDAYYTFHFSVKVNTTRSLLKDAIDSSLGAAFPNASRSLFDYVVCDGKFPHLTMTHGNASCADCPAGQYWSEINYTCAYCPKDTYRTKTDPLGICTACPVNKTTSEQIGQKTSAACHDICSAGQFYNDFTRKCQLCPRGTYQERRGAAACVPCSSDATTTIEGAKNATDCFNPCGPGEELVADEANCVPCARGTYWVNGSFTGCQVCPQGLTTFDTGCKDIRDCEVVTCPVGTHVNINRTDPINPLSTAFDLLCIKCEMGTYQDENNQTSCKPCTPTSNCDLIQPAPERSKWIIWVVAPLVAIQPAPERSKWIIWVVAPLVAVIIVAALGFTIWICRNSIYLPGCCRKRDLKNMESTDYYRDRPRPVPRRRVSSTDYRNYPPRHSIPVRPIETISTAATVAPPRLSLEDPSRIRLRERHLPPPIITSKAELDLLEEQAILAFFKILPHPFIYLFIYLKCINVRTTQKERHLPPPIITSKVELDLLEEQARARRTLVSNVLPVSSRSLGSQIVTGYSNESPGPSISAQLAPPRHRTFSGGQQPYLCDLPEDPSSSYSLHWSETTPGDSNDVYGDDDDDEDYFG
ncbi:hypothetical protein Q1695_010207 [Nippostrongylus brasiliensis]|nr:hypothetical protein Q1695_010207 [Nippostrongylus brasiliensis]